MDTYDTISWVAIERTPMKRRCSWEYAFVISSIKSVNMYSFNHESVSVDIMTVNCIHEELQNVIVWWRLNKYNSISWMSNAPLIFWYPTCSVTHLSSPPLSTCWTPTIYLVREIEIYRYLFLWGIFVGTHIFLPYISTPFFRKYYYYILSYSQTSFIKNFNLFLLRFVLLVLCSFMDLDTLTLLQFPPKIYITIFLKRFIYRDCAFKVCK